MNEKEKAFGGRGREFLSPAPGLMTWSPTGLLPRPLQVDSWGASCLLHALKGRDRQSCFWLWQAQVASLGTGLTIQEFNWLWLKKEKKRKPLHPIKNN